MTTSNKTYRQFNTVSFEGRVFNAEIPQGRDFASVTIITSVEDDREITVTFTNSNGIMSLVKNGHLKNGRPVIVTGHISDVSQTYVKDGQVKMRKRPNINITGASLQLGFTAKKEEAAIPAGTVVDTTPDFA